MADKIDKDLTKKVKHQIFGEKEGRRSVNSPARGPERRSPVARRSPGRLGGRRITDPVSHPKLTERDLRVAATDSSGAATAASRGTITGAPARQARPELLPKREWMRATESLPRSRGPIAGGGRHTRGILSKAGRWGKLGAMALGGYAAYKAWKDK